MVIGVYPTVVMNFVNMILKRCSTIKLFSTESALLLMLLCFVFLVCFLWLAVVWTDVRVLPQNISLCSFTTFKIRFLRVSFYWCFISFHLRRFNVSSCKKKKFLPTRGKCLAFQGYLILEPDLSEPFLHLSEVHIFFFHGFNCIF